MKSVQRRIDDKSVFSSIDLNRSLYALTETPLPEGHALDGEDVCETIPGKATGGREAPIFFRRPPDRPGFGHGYDDQDNPDLGAVSGTWKYLVNLDGSDSQLYDLASGPGETKNLMAVEPGIASRLKEALFAWNASMPADASDPEFSPGPAPAAAKAKAKAKAKERSREISDDITAGFA